MRKILFSVNSFIVYQPLIPPTFIGRGDGVVSVDVCHKITKFYLFERDCVRLMPRALALPPLIYNCPSLYFERDVMVHVVWRLDSNKNVFLNSKEQHNSNDSDNKTWLIIKSYLISMC